MNNSEKMNVLFLLIYGKILWKRLRKSHHITHDDVILVLLENNKEMNNSLLKYIDKFADRRCAGRIIILCEKDFHLIEKNNVGRHKYLCVSMDYKSLYRLYMYSRIRIFFSNIVFGVYDYPSFNLIEEILKDGKMSSDEIACLCFYSLREVIAESEEQKYYASR